MYCDNCGKELRQGAKFCRYCGAKVMAETPAASEEVKPEETAAVTEADRLSEPVIQENAEQLVVTSKQTAEEPAVTVPADTAPAVKKRKLIPILCSLMLLAAAVGAGLYFGVFNKMEKDSSDSSAADTSVSSESAPAVTTTTTTTTTVESVAPVDNNKTVDRISSLAHFNWEKDPINSSKGFNTTDANNIFYMSGNDAWVFWRFTDTGIVGCGLDYLNAYDAYDKIVNTENVAYAETYFGFTASIKNKTLSVNNYYNLDGVKCSDIKITYMNGTTPRYAVTADKGVTADLSDESYVNGYYAITAEYTSVNKHKYIANMYLYINYASNNDSDFEAYVCYGRHLYSFETEGPTTRQAKITEMIEAQGITPENSLNYNIAYPYEAKGHAEHDGYSTYVSDTEYWINKSDEILAGHENDSAAYKALLLHDWMTENLVYDWYKANRLNNPRYYGHYHTGEFYVSQCYVGVCRDFTNIYAIMCRKHGIPCIILGNTAEGHVWNAVYLYDQWLEVDLTRDIDREARNADVTDVTAATQENTHSFRCFCSYAYSDLMPVESEINTWLHYREQ